MRHRPGLCVSGRRREARPPMLTRTILSAARKRCQSNKRPETPHMGGISWTWWTVLSQALRPRGCRARRPRPRRARTPPARGSARRRPATMVGARSGSRPGTSRRSFSGSAAAARGWRASRSAESRWPSTSRPLGAEVDAGGLGRGAGHRDRGGDALALARREPPRRARAPPRPASAPSSAAVGGSECRWRSEWRTTPIWVETWKRTSPALADHELGRAAADVDHQQPLAGRGVAGGGRAEVGQPRLLVAGQRAGVEAEALARPRARTRRRWPRRAPPRSSPRRCARAPCSAIASRVLPEHLEHPLPAARRRAGRWRRRPRPAASRPSAARPPRAGRRRRRRRSAAASSSSRCRRPRRGSVGLVRHRLAGQRGEQVVDGDLGHLVARPHGRRADVGDDEQVRRLAAAGGRRAAARGR